VFPPSAASFQPSSAKPRRFHHSDIAQCHRDVQNLCKRFKVQRVGSNKSVATFTCPACNQEVHREWARCDHYHVSLRELIKAFDRQTEIAEWKAFHKKYATLRVVCKDCEIADPKDTKN
jgi:hypothetical protein